jgi:hypothetical protein
MFDELIDRLQNRRTLILGIGNPLRGDDGLGPALIKRLQGKVGAVMIDAGDAPENHLFAIAKANPQAIVTWQFAHRTARSLNLVRLGFVQSLSGLRW